MTDTGAGTPLTAEEEEFLRGAIARYGVPSESVAHEWWRKTLATLDAARSRPATDPAGLREAAERTRDLLANYLWNEDDSGDENDLVAAYDELRDILGHSTEAGVGATLARLAVADGPGPEERWVEAAREVVALLTTSGQEPPPLNDSGLLSTLAFYAGPNARTAVDPEQAKRVTALSEATRRLRAALPEHREETGRS